MSIEFRGVEDYREMYSDKSIITFYDTELKVFGKLVVPTVIADHIKQLLAKMEKVRNV